MAVVKKNIAGSNAFFCNHFYHPSLLRNLFFKSGINKGRRGQKRKNKLKASVDQLGDQAIFSLQIFDEPVVVINPNDRSDDQIPPQNS